MAALRFSLLVAVLLGLVLLTAPDQASANTAFALCDSDRISCSRRGLRCAECSDHCTKASKTSQPGRAVRAKTWAWICTHYGRK